MKSVGIRCFFLLFASFGGHAATITLQPVADTTLAEFVPNNNLGGTEFVIAGTAGVNANGARNRALYRFNLSSIPANSKIKSAKVRLEVAHAPPGAEQSMFSLHRMMRAWGEGNKNSTTASSPGLGFAATTNEATWNSPFAFSTNLWTSVGATNDFVPVPSSSTGVSGVGDFPLFGSNQVIVADVQTWLDNPASNFGWLLKTEAEEIFFTARRFGSREFVGIDTNSPPFVEIQFIPPPIISESKVQGGRFQFSFLAEAEQIYLVEFKNALAATNTWQTLTNIGAQTSATNILISDSLSANAKFYRVVAP